MGIQKFRKPIIAPHYTDYQQPDSLGAGTKQGGFADYNPAGSSQTLLKGQWHTLANDGLGAFTNEGYLPEGVTTMLAASGGINPRELDLGDWLVIRPDYEVTPNINGGQLQFRFSLGTGADAYVLETRIGRLDSGSGIGYKESGVAYFIYMGDTNTRDNDIDFQLNLEGGGSVQFNGWSVGVFRRNDS